MIRFIDLRGQITQDNTTTFAFYDTTIDSFVKFDGSDNFDTIEEFIDYFKSDKNAKTWDLNRFLGLIPKDFFDSKSLIFPIFKRFPQNKPSFNDTNFLVIIKIGNTYSYAFRYYDGEKFEVDKKGELILAFSETDPASVLSFIE